ncbi:hypothetical protein [Prauserella endophytica]|uniref:Uncharacterized protein n=1 Tax=Prauserella endophytica TaxID=1592324 RepID=A0ABY2RUD2_9PSEU|nr:hypothetical protein [Prauserella endophytica]TKG60944.1 hypothetical protein FCN18_34505 [Prauserella endophytica]
MTTTTTPETTHATTPSVPPRMTKHDRVALDAIHIAAALPGRWTLGRGRNRYEVADLLCLDTGTRIGVLPWERRAWGYDLVPGEVPRWLRDVFVWPREHDPDAHPGFAVGTPAAEVAAYIHDTLLPRYHRALAQAETAKRERDATRARERAARDQIAEQLQRGFPPEPDHDPRWPERVQIYYLGFDDLMRIQLTMPVDDAIARAPALARALDVPVDDDTTTPSQPGDNPDEERNR